MILNLGDRAYNICTEICLIFSTASLVLLLGILIKIFKIRLKKKAEELLNLDSQSN